MKCECGNKIWFIAAACLIVGGLAGYWYANQANNEYLSKGFGAGIMFACGQQPGATDASLAECYANSKQAFENEYLTKAQTPKYICPPNPQWACDAINNGGIKLP